MHASYHGVEVYECAPNGQGLTALAALAMLDGLSPAVGSAAHGSAAHLHPLIEALRLAFADSRWFVADPEHVRVPTEALLSPAYVAARRARIDPAKATADAQRGAPEQQSNTVSFQVVDAAGGAVSMVNSNFCGFGTAIVPHGCGFSLQNRGSNFALEPEHPNALAGGKRPFHTIIPAIVLKGGALFASLTNMGGFMQPQGHVQLLVNMIDYGMEPQARPARHGDTCRGAGATGALHGRTSPHASPHASRAALACAGRDRRAPLLHRRREHGRPARAAQGLPRGGPRRGHRRGAAAHGARHRRRRERPRARHLRQGADHPAPADRRALGRLRRQGRWDGDRLVKCRPLASGCGAALMNAAPTSRCLAAAGIFI